MNLTLGSFEEQVRSFAVAGGEPARRALESLALDEFRSGRLTRMQLRIALGFATAYELDGFLKKNQIWLEYDDQDLARERCELEQLGL